MLPPCVCLGALLGTPSSPGSPLIIHSSSGNKAECARNCDTVQWIGVNNILVFQISDFTGCILISQTTIDTNKFISFNKWEKKKRDDKDEKCGEEEEKWWRSKPFE